MVGDGHGGSQCSISLVQVTEEWHHKRGRYGVLPQYEKKGGAWQVIRLRRFVLHWGMPLNKIVSAME